MELGRQQLLLPGAKDPRSEEKFQYSFTLAGSPLLSKMNTVLSDLHCGAWNVNYRIQVTQN